MTDKEQYIEKELAEKESKMKLDAHNKSVVRNMAAKEWHFWEREGRDYSQEDAGEINKGNVREY